MLLTKVVVGSRLHGLNNKDSDYDYRGVHMHALKYVLSPFKKLKNTSWVEGNEDNTSYELREFVKMAVYGNPTILEVLFSNKVIETTPIFEELRDNRMNLIDTKRFISSSKGYASNQYNKMKLFDPDARTPKFAVAYLRVLWQCEQFLKHNEFPCVINDTELRDFLMEVKYNFSKALVPKLSDLFVSYQEKILQLEGSCCVNNPEIKYIEDFLLRAYK